MKQIEFCVLLSLIAAHSQRANEGVLKHIFLLTLDLSFDLAQFVAPLVDGDLDATLILVCLGRHELRARVGQRRSATPISRRQIAQRTGLSREVVRRRVQDLLDANILARAKNDGVRLQTSFLESPAALEAAAQADEAVRRYIKRADTYLATKNARKAAD